MSHAKYPAARQRFPDCLKENIPGTKNATQYHPVLEGTAGKDINDQIDTFGVMWELQRRVRNNIPCHKEHQGPPATLELWQFALRHYLNLTFKPGTFWMPRDCDCVWWREVGRGKIFINPNWNVVQKYKPGLFRGITEIIESFN